jgi:hypothetical protein
VHIAPRWVVGIAVAGVALAACVSRSNNVVTVHTAGRTSGSLAAAASVSGSGTQTPDLMHLCSAQLASWTDNGTSVLVQINPQAKTFLAVSVEAATMLAQGAASLNGGALSLPFAVPGAQVQAIRLRVNETGCKVQRSGP